MDEREPKARERAEFLILELCDGMYSHTEIIAQMLVSVWMSGDCSYSTIADEARMLLERVIELFESDGRLVWPGLKPGGAPPSEPKYEIIPVGEKRRVLALDVAQLPNIILDYPVIVYFSAMDSALYAAAAEVFRDEHGVQWIKFIARNGHEAGKEHILRTDQVVIVRDETFRGE